MKKVLITSALPYVNNIPHLGNLIGSMLSADVYARHKRLQGCEVLYVCGADEHGTATEARAREEGVSPQELCDRFEKEHRRIYDWFGISFDVWGRTHTETQTRIVQEIFTDLDANGYILEEEVEQLYDEQAQQYLADRFVEGICPHCGAPGARGDQCDTCQRLVNATELKDPVSKLTGTKPVLRTSKHLFLDLPRLKGSLVPWVEKNKDRWSHNAAKITQNWLSDLKPRAITRDLSWGVPVPKEGYTDKVFYVWFDAPIGYISITAHARKDWEQWWKRDVPLVQFMGKDNVVFHTVIFPSSLLGTGKDWNLLDRLSTTEFLNMEKGKFSKSRGTGVFGDDCIRIQEEFGVPADVWRYYLLAIRPETADATFSWKDLHGRTNNELIANYANLVNRTLQFAHANLSGEEARLGERQELLLKESAEHAQRATGLLDDASLREALHEAMALSKRANQYFQHQKPWETVKTDKAKAAADVHALLTVIRDVSLLLSPFIPHAAAQTLRSIGQENATYADIGVPLPPDTVGDIAKAEPLFAKIEEDTIAELERRYGPKEHPLDLRAARITEARKHPNADKLLLLQLDLGEEKRQVVAGLAGHYTLGELAGKTIVMIANLEPAKLRGEISEGMVLAGEKGESVGLLRTDAKPGTRFPVAGKEGSATPISFADFQKHIVIAEDGGLIVDGEAVAGAFTVEKDAHGRLR